MTCKRACHTGITRMANGIRLGESPLSIRRSWGGRSPEQHARHAARNSARAVFLLEDPLTLRSPGKQEAPSIPLQSPPIEGCVRYSGLGSGSFSMLGFIDEILEADRQAPRKQRHTAHRIYGADLAESGRSYPIAESTVRQYVRERKRTLGLRGARGVRAAEYAWGERGAGRLVRGGRRPGRRAGHAPGVLRCAAWPVGRRFIGPIRARRSRRFWKRTSWAFQYFGGVVPPPALRQPRAQRCRRSCAASGARRRRASWRSARTGSSRRSSVRRARAMRRAAWKAKSGPSGAITGCRCPRRATWRS